MENYNVYKDIQARTGGEIYIGVVGPVRTGKSTFIKRFMNLLVIPEIKDVHQKERAIDELPLSSQGKLITTVEPKFIPKEAVAIDLGDDIEVKIRMIDSVGYMVEGAAGNMIEGKERMVKTPWQQEEIPFAKAAEIGTRKVIADHSTIGIVITADGSFGELNREAFKTPEERTINELKQLEKPFIVVLNTQYPYSADTLEIREEMEKEYGVPVVPLNCEQLRKDDIQKIMTEVLHAFPVSELHFWFPNWVDMLPAEHMIKQDIIRTAREILNDTYFIRDIIGLKPETETTYIKNCKTDSIDMQTGIITITFQFDTDLYYQVLSELTGLEIKGEYQFVKLLKELVENRSAYEKVEASCEEVNRKGYSIVMPAKEEIELSPPELIKHGNKFGVKLKASAPSVNMINANIVTEIAPIVGTEEQAQDLIHYIEENSKNGPEGVWDTNIFGKSILELVEDGIHAKIDRLTDESRVKLQNSMEKIINESNGGFICFII